MSGAVSQKELNDKIEDILDGISVYSDPSNPAADPRTFMRQACYKLSNFYEEKLKNSETAYAVAQKEVIKLQQELKLRTLQLSQGRYGKPVHIVTTFAEPAAGPGWANAPVIVIFKDENNRLGEEYIQPAEQTKEIQLLYGISSQIHGQMVNEVGKIFPSKKGGKKS